jgi:RND family efflux transporter MFP subunit
MTQSSTQNVVTGEAEGESRRRAGRRLLVIGVLIVIALVGALAVGTLPRLWQQQKLNTAAAQAASQSPRVTVAIAKRMAPTAERILPGNSLPLMEATLYARATGYVSKRSVDIGDQVKEGQLLLEISAPDIDDQLEQAKANLELSKANLTSAQASAKLAQINFVRYRDLVKTNTVATQEFDQAKATAETTAAQVASAHASIQVNQAAVKRFTDLQSFEKITAPFAGVITARNVDPGDLLTADNTTSREMFHIMQTDVVRVWVNVPQLLAPGIRVGQQANVFHQLDPTRMYTGKVARTADALDPKTRTLLTELQVPNPDNTLRPGMYLQVKFVFDRSTVPVLIPAAALASRSDGPRVPVLDNQNRVHYRPIQLGRDYGADIEVIAGLSPGETVVVHPGDDIPEGTAVEPVAPSK